MGERERARSGADGRAVDDDGVPQARTLSVDERFADASRAGERGHHQHFDARGIAVVEGLEQSALFERAGGGVEIAEVAQTVGELDFTKTHAERRIGVEGFPRHDFDRAATFVSHQHVDAAERAGRGQRIGAHHGDPACLPDGTRELVRDDHGRVAFSGDHAHVATADPERESTAARREPLAAAERHQVRRRRIHHLHVELALGAKHDAALTE